MQGKPHHLEQMADHPGLIPACAGKTSTPTSRPCPPRAHPRVCGENECGEAQGLAGGGSSPRVRENVNSPMMMTAWPGSSPRVRGKPGRLAATGRPARLIPARAGKTYCRINCLRTRRAHPRACGENVGGPGEHGENVGSSPRVRGKREGHLLAADADGLIPARAGKTAAAPIVSSHCAAHPRACGENTARARQGTSVLGSSPRVRGKHGREPADRRRPGLIPARAGKTEGEHHAAVLEQAHPRACGENTHGRL